MMDLHAFIVIAFTQVTVLAQKYKKTDVFTSRESFKTKISPMESQFIFDVNTCSTADISFYNNGVLIHWLILRPTSSSLSVEIKKGPSSFILVQQTVQLAMCNKLQKFKFMWNHNGKVSLWTTELPGWRLLFSKEDLNPFLKGFDFISLWSFSAAWKIYQIEHTTEPFNRMCTGT